MAERADQLDLSARRPASTGVDLPFCGYIEDEPSWKKTPIKVSGRYIVYIQFCKFGRYLQRYKAEILEDAATTSTCCLLASPQVFDYMLQRVMFALDIKKYAWRLVDPSGNADLAKGHAGFQKGNHRDFFCEPRTSKSPEEYG